MIDVINAYKNFGKIKKVQYDNKIVEKNFTVYQNKTVDQSIYEISSGLYIYTLKGINICCIAKKAPNGYFLRLNNGDEIIIDKEFYDFYNNTIKGEMNESV